MKRMIAGLISLLLVCSLAGGVAEDVVTSASQVYYTDSSLSLEALEAAIAHAQGACTVATVNQDGSPLLVGGSPAMLNQTHIAFGWNNNVTMANMLRTGQAMMCYYLFDSEGATKMDRHQGARLVLSLETDAEVIAALRGAYPSLPPYATILRIEALLPLG